MSPRPTREGDIVVEADPDDPFFDEPNVQVVHLDAAPARVPARVISKAARQAERSLPKPLSQWVDEGPVMRVTFTRKTRRGWDFTLHPLLEEQQRTGVLGLGFFITKGDAAPMVTALRRLDHEAALMADVVGSLDTVGVSRNDIDINLTLDETIVARSEYLPEPETPTAQRLREDINQALANAGCEFALHGIEAYVYKCNIGDRDVKLDLFYQFI